jgi:hypothetical protein
VTHAARTGVAAAGPLLAALAATFLVIGPGAAGTALHGGPRSADGPEPGHTGGFGEPTCHVCHFDGPLNPPGASVAIEGLPDSFAPGRTYRFDVVVRGEDLRRAGFQAAIRFSAGDSVGRSAGTLAPTDNRAAIVRAANGISYAQHVYAGTAPVEPRIGRWSLDWTAPADGAAPVVLHIAANAADDNNSESGDAIVTARRVLRPAAR